MAVFWYEVPMLNVVMTYVFTMFSHVLWPIYVPFSIGLMETIAWRKNVILLFQFIGVAIWFYTVAFFSVWCFFAAILSEVIYLHFKTGEQRSAGSIQRVA